MPTKSLTADHKNRMAQGRRQTKIVERYLQQIERSTSKKKSVSPAEIADSMAQVALGLESASGIERLELLQRREDLQRLALEAEPEDDGELENQFIAVAKSYGERKKISYSTWREFGVPKDVLEQAGIPRTRRAQKVTED